MPLANPINPQQQPTDRCCVASCIAMAIGIDVHEMGWPLEAEFSIQDFGVYLVGQGVWLRPCIRIGGFGEHLEPNRLYIVSVPSLNDIAGAHCVLHDKRREWPQVIDPHMGRDGKRVYSYVDESIALDFCELLE